MTANRVSAVGKSGGTASDAGGITVSSRLPNSQTFIFAWSQPMRPLLRGLPLTVLMFLAAALVFADEGKKRQKGGKGRRGGRHHKLTVARFDKDGDGKLNEEEF